MFFMSFHIYYSYKMNDSFDECRNKNNKKDYFCFMIWEESKSMMLLNENDYSILKFL